MAALTRKDLDEKPCGRCGESHETSEPVLFTSRCHPEHPLQMIYQDGVLIISCDECGEFIASIKVAEP